MSERKIGKVISVDSFRIVVQLDEDLKSLYKSGFNDIYEIARINSYLIIPVGADRIVAIVTRVKIQDETEIEKTTGFITLPKAQRYLVATMIGTIEWIDSVITRSGDIQNFWKMRNANITTNVAAIKALNIDSFDTTTLLTHLTDINSLIPAQGSYNDPDISKLAIAVDGAKAEVEKYNATLITKRIIEDKNIDLPVWFDYNKLITQHFDEAINEQENSSNRIREFVSTLRLRLQSYLNDERISEPLLLNQNANINEALSKFLAFILGDLFKIYNTATNDIYSSYFKEQLIKDEPEKVSDQKPNQITIIDMSLIPFEVLETITGLIGRLVLEFLSRFNNEHRGDFPVVIVLEEAQNYIPEKDRSDKVSISKKVFERVAREGRKFGLSLLVSSQRPSELSKTVLSQCNSFIIHRLQNPDDQKYVKQLVSAANEDILQQLPVLPQQVAIIMGDGVRTPIQMRVNTAKPKPNSDNPKFIEKWLQDVDKAFPDYKLIAKNWEEGKMSSDITDNNSPIT